MEDTCLRNMSCKCRLCAGEDISMLLNITKSISSNITYTDEDGGDSGMVDAPPPPSSVTNSPPVPSMMRNPPPTNNNAAVPQRKPFPPRRLAAAKATARSSSVREEPMEVVVSEDDAMMEDVPMASATTATVNDVAMESDVTEEMNIDMTPAAPLVMTVLPPPAPVSALAPAAAPAVMEMETTSVSSEQWSMEDLLVKLTDKNWKIRKQAYEQVMMWCERPGTRHEAVASLVEMFSKICEDTNASALEAGIQAILTYTLHVEPFYKGIVPSVMKRVVDKGLSSRPGTVKICEELVMALIEAGAVEETITALMEGTKNKKPKVPPLCVSCVLEALKAFGPRVIPIQAVKAALPSLCESTTNGVRPLALNVVAEIHRWTGPTLVQDIVSNLRQAQQVEYEALTKDMVVGQAQPTRFVRGAKRPSTVASTGGKVVATGRTNGSNDPTAAFDPREFAETVNLMEKLAKTEFRTKLASSKWSEKVEALKIVLGIIGPVPKLAINGDYYELMATLKLLSNDANVNIVAKAIEVMGALSDGLRKAFTQHARVVYPDLIKKLSDKKSVIINAVNTTLDLFLQHSLTLDMMMEELKMGVDPSKNKAPQARVQVLSFLSRCVGKRMPVVVSDKTVVVEFGTLFVNGLEDVDPTVRKAATDALVELVKIMTELQTPHFVQGLMDDVARLNPRAFKTIQQGLGNGTGTGSNASSRPSSAGSSGLPVSAEIPDVEMDMPAPVAPALVSRKASIAQKPAVRGAVSSSRVGGAAKAPVALPTRKSAPAGGHSSSNSTTSNEFVPFSISVVPEEVEGILMELPIDGLNEIHNGLASTKWMERKQALERLEEFARTHTSVLTLRVNEALTLFISMQVKQFKDSNIMVLRSAFRAIGTFAEHAVGKFPRGVVCAVVPSAIDKIGDKKASETIRTMLLQLAEATNPTYVLGCMVQHMENVKTPLAHIEVLTVLSDVIRDFGVSVCSPRMVIDYVKGSCGLESSNPKVRTGAIAVLASMYAQLGPSLLPILDLSSWKPALASTVEAEFKKTGFDPTNAIAAGVKRQVRDDGEGGAKSRNDPTALFGRVDISAQLTKELMNDMKCEEDKAAWKKRLAAMDSIQSICESAGCAIEFTKPVMELMKALKARLSDSNANLKVRAVQIIGLVATSIGPEVGKLSKLLGPSILGGVSDNKKNMQVASIETLHKWVRHGNKTSTACVDSLLSSVSEGLMNPVGRVELLGWLAEHLRACDRALDLNGLVAPTIQCLMDKSSEAREKAQLVLGEVMKSVGKDSVLTNGCRDIKPAQMRTLRPLIDKAYEMAMADNSQLSATSSSLPIPAALSVPSDPRMARANSMPNKIGTTAAVGRSSLVRPSSGAFRNDSSNAIALESVPLPSTSGNGEPSPTGAMLKMNSNKPSRLAKGQFNKWIFDSTSPTELANRKNEIELEWRPYLTTEFHAKLFAPTLEKGMMTALSDLLTCISSQPQEVLAALDLIFKWCTLRIVDNNVQALAKVLEVLVSLFEFLKSIGYQLDDVEASILLPYLLQESGQSKPRFRVRFRDIMRLVVNVYSTENYVTYLLDCCNTSKNMKSRCECIDTMEYIIKTHGFQAVGKRCVKEIGKYVLVHEKEVRESAMNALMAVYLRTDGNVDRFFRFTGVTTTQGMDLLTARIKHLPATSVPDGSAMSSSLNVRTPPRTTPSVGNSTTPMSGLKQFNTVAATTAPSSQYEKHYGQEDVHMATPARELDQTHDPLHEENETIESFLFRPIEALLTETREIVNETSSQYADGIDSLKGLYTILYEPNGEAEVAFIKCHVNDIVIRLCDCIHGALGHGGDTTNPIAMVVLTLSLSALHQLLQCPPAVESIQRYAVERILLEISTRLLDPRFEDLATQGGNLSSLLNRAESMPVDKRRLLYIYKALTTVMTATTKRIKAGELFPSVINLLQRIVRNDVGEYNARDSYNHLMKKDSLDQLVGRLLLKISTTQANTMLNAFEGVDIFGILMQMHSFFSTLPQNDLFAVQIANDNMQRALGVIAESLVKTRPTSFEASVNDLPLNSPVRELLTQLGHVPASTRLDPTTVGVTSSSSFSMNLSSGVRATTTFESSNTTNITRRLFDAGSTQTMPTTASPLVNRFGGSFRYSSKTNMTSSEAPKEKTQNVKDLRVRLAAVRKFDDTDKKPQDGSIY